MSRQLHSIPIESFFAPSSLFGDFAGRQGGAIASILGGFNAESPRWSAPPAHAGERGGFFDRLVEYNRVIGVGGTVVKKLSGVADGSSRVVITGQQPGVLGGPLLTLYKIETAVALADHVERTQGVPCVPVYWMGADDVDFAEIRELVMVNAEHTVLATSLPTGAHEVARPVGDIDVRWLDGLWNGLDAFVGGFPGSERVVGAVNRSIADGGDHGGVTARLITALTDGAVAVVDAREPLLREAARDVILDYMDREDEVRAAVEAAGRDLESKGYHAQLTLGPDSGVFVVEDGRRKKITAEQRATVRDRLAGDVSAASPGVVLRNLVQDVVFDPLAVVLGPAEIAYRAQIRGVYDLFGLEPPVSFPRLFATCVPPEIGAIVEEVGGDVTRLVEAPREFVKAVYESQADATLEEARRRFEGGFDDGLDAFVSALDGRVDAPTVEKIKKRLADVRRRLGQAAGGVTEAGRGAARSRWPYIESLTDIFERKGVPQERYLTLLTPFLFAGDGALGAVRAAAQHHVQAALDGRVEHVVYS